MSRSENLYRTLMDKTILADFFQPALTALSKVRHRVSNSTSLPMNIYMLVSCLRHLQGQKSMREQLQQMFHIANEEKMPIARASYSEALNCQARALVLQNVVRELTKIAGVLLPDRLSKVEGVGARKIYAADGSYQKESAHYGRKTPRDGGTDNHKGHMMLTFYDVRLGVPIGVRIETSNRHELLVLKDELLSKESCFEKVKGAIFIVDRAFVHMSFWDNQKSNSKTTMITRSKTNLIFTSSQSRTVEANAINEGVSRDEEVTLQASKEPWRRIFYKSPNGNDYEFLTNDFTLMPGVVAFLYLRRWDEEKCFDTWKNDFSCSKAWAKSINGIYQQALFAIMTSILTALFSKHHQDSFNIGDEKCFNKQDVLSAHQTKVCGERNPWYRSVYRAASKISRQVIRFLKMCFLTKASHKVYERQLKPLLLMYL